MSAVSFVSTTRPREVRNRPRTPQPVDGAQLDDPSPRPLADQLEEVVESWARSRLVKERDGVCLDCGRGELLQYDHVPAHETTGHTVTTELELRCAPCHQQRHQAK